MMLSLAFLRAGSLLMALQFVNSFLSDPKQIFGGVCFTEAGNLNLFLLANENDKLRILMIIYLLCEHPLQVANEN